MKSAGLAGSMLSSSDSFSSGSRRKTWSSSGTIRMSTSMVLERQPVSTAVAPPVKYRRISRLAARPTASVNARMRSASADRTHSQARSKLTRRRMRALYREWAESACSRARIS